MNTNNDEKVNSGTPEWLVRLLPFISAVLGGGAIWYTWFSYNDMIESGFMWYEWIRPVFMLLIGILCLTAALLFILGKSSGWSVLMWGLFMVPIMLFTNLVAAIIRGISTITQGNAQPFFDKILAHPAKLIAVPIVVIALILLGMLSKSDTNKKSN